MTRRRSGRGVAFLAVLFFAALAALPWLFSGHAPPPWVQAAVAASPVPLPAAPAPLPPVALSAIATPEQPYAAPASPPSSANALHQAALVAGEDARLRTLMHNTNHLSVPSVILVPGAAPTLVLPARPQAYGLSDLENAGAVTSLGQGSFILIDSVLIRPAATLSLGDSDGLTHLSMNSGASTFTSVVVWGGTLEISGQSSRSPLAINGWDQVDNNAAQDRGFGRPYIRDAGGRLDVRYVRFSNLGFWSGRTGGVAWTGLTREPATGSAASSTFIGNTYGAFVSTSEKVAFSNDLFEGNELDGLRLHKGASGSTITSSASVRNGANGFVVARGATSDELDGDVAVNDAGNGFLLNGSPLSNGASPSGDSGGASVGTVLEGSEAERNARTGILVEGGVGTVVRDDIVCGVATAIAINRGAADSFVVGNEIRCGTRIALSIGPAVTGTTVWGNTFDAARIGVLIRNSPGVRLIDNRFNAITIFGMSIRGSSPGVVGTNNVITGRGFAAIDVRGGAPTPRLTNSNLDGWQHSSVATVWSYLRYHPLLTAWVAILTMVAVFWVITRFRRRMHRPYRHHVPWQPTPLAGPPVDASSTMPLVGELVLTGAGVNAQPVTAFAASENHGGERSPNLV